MYSNVALYLTIDGQRKFVGKHIGNTIYRDFPFSKAKLRKGDALGSDIRLLEYARYHNVAGFVFTDPKKKVSLVGLRSKQLLRGITLHLLLYVFWHKITKYDKCHLNWLLSYNSVFGRK